MVARVRSAFTVAGSLPAGKCHKPPRRHANPSKGYNMFAVKIALYGMLVGTVLYMVVPVVAFLAARHRGRAQDQEFWSVVASLKDR